MIGRIPKPALVMAPSTSPLVRRAGLLLAALIVPFVVLRLWLAATPDADFDVAGYNIHHLFTGVLLVVAGGVPLALFGPAGRRGDAAIVVFGVGLSLVLDEWVYLIATDGSNASYLLPVSFWGGVVMIGLAVGFVVALVLGARARVDERAERSGNDPGSE